MRTERIGWPKSSTSFVQSVPWNERAVTLIIAGISCLSISGNVLCVFAEKIVKTGSNLDDRFDLNRTISNYIEDHSTKMFIHFCIESVSCCKLRCMVLLQALIFLLKNRSFLEMCLKASLA